MAESFHHQLKAYLAARGKRERWDDNLPHVLLGIRSTFKDDLNGTLAELVYATTLWLPGDFLSVSTPLLNHPFLTIYGTFGTFLRTLGLPVPGHTLIVRPLSVEIWNRAPVFVRRDAVRPPLAAP